jgi:hypothetical protein
VSVCARSDLSCQGSKLKNRGRVVRAKGVVDLASQVCSQEGVAAQGRQGLAVQSDRSLGGNGLQHSLAGKLVAK